MAAVETLQILGQIQVLVIDKLQVVSYKWLSRNFSVSSNKAKRLLQEFADKHDQKLEVLYSLSGWSKNNSGTYCVKLASTQRLEEALKEFDGNCSVEVYSIQSCLPKDLAVLWNAEFIQSEELYNQPSSAENSLRNNRLGGISNPFVERAVDCQTAAISATSQVKDNAGIMQTKACKSLKDESLQQQQIKTGKLGAKEGVKSSNTVGSVVRTAENVDDITKKSNTVKESSNPVQGKKKGVPNEKASSGPGGSLANLWGRASVKSKPSNTVLQSSNNIPNSAYTADAQICAKEGADTVSSDDESYGVSYKRELNGSGTRKRQFIINYSDEEDDDDNAVSLESPIPPSEKLFSDSLQSTENLNVEKDKLDSDKLKTKILLNNRGTSENNYGFSSENNTSAEVLLQKVENDSRDELANKNGKDNVPTASKRKKVVKTRIDERGREVMEVVWEDSFCINDANNDNTTKDTGEDITTIDAGNRSSAAIKEQATRSDAPANTGAKGGSKKQGKAGGKDAKQGNILSFFKKV